MEEIATTEEQPKQHKNFEVIVENMSKDDHSKEDLSFKYIVERLDRLAEVMPCSYFAILHDKDEEDGKHKRNHTHIVFQFETKRTLQGVLNRLQKMLSCDINKISISVADSLSYAIKYLTHRTLLAQDEKKHEYDHSEVKTNNGALYRTELSKKVGDIYAEDLITICQRKNYHKPSIMKLIGTTAYMRYRLLIADICEGRNTLREELEDMVECQKVDMYEVAGFMDLDLDDAKEKGYVAITPKQAESLAEIVGLVLRYRQK